MLQRCQHQNLSVSGMTVEHETPGIWSRVLYAEQWRCGLLE